MDSPLLRRTQQLPLTSAHLFLLGIVLMSDRLLDEVHTKWVVFKRNQITLIYINLSNLFFFWLNLIIGIKVTVDHNCCLRKDFNPSCLFTGIFSLSLSGC